MWSNLVFYAQSTRTVISKQGCEEKKKMQRIVEMMWCYLTKDILVEPYDKYVIRQNSSPIKLSVLMSNVCCITVTAPQLKPLGSLSVGWDGSVCNRLPNRHTYKCTLSLYSSSCSPTAGISVNEFVSSHVMKVTTAGSNDDMGALSTANSSLLPQHAD